MSFLSKNQIFYTTAIITVITLFAFIYANYKYTNFLLTNANMIYITSLILGLVVTYASYSHTPHVPQKKETPPTTTTNVDQQPSQPTLTQEEKDKIQFDKQRKIYNLVFQILATEAFIADKRKGAFQEKSGMTPASLENMVLAIPTLTNAIISSKPEEKQAKTTEQLTKLTNLIISMNDVFETNIIVALQLIYDIDTKNSQYSDQLLRHAQSDAINMLSTELNSITPIQDDEYFNKDDLYMNDYGFLYKIINELDDALSDFLDPNIKQKYELVAESFLASRMLSGPVGNGGKGGKGGKGASYFYVDNIPTVMYATSAAAVAAATAAAGTGTPSTVITVDGADGAEGADGVVVNKGSFKDLISQVFNNADGISRFMDTLYDIIVTLKNS